MAQSLIACPLCSAISFSSTSALCLSLISVTSKWLRCTLCEEELRGLDKLTVHLLSHLIHTADFKRFLTTDNVLSIDAKLTANPEPLNLVKPQNEQSSEEINQKLASEFYNSFSSQSRLATDVGSERPSLKIDDEVMIFFNDKGKSVQDASLNTNKIVEKPFSTELPKFTINFNQSTSNQEMDTLATEERNRMLSDEFFDPSSTNQVPHFFFTAGTSCTEKKNPMPNNESTNNLLTTSQDKINTSSFVETDGKPNAEEPNVDAPVSNDCNVLDKELGNKSSFLSPRGERVMGYRCDVCSLVFPDENILSMHRQLIHLELNSDPSKTRRYKCHLCSKSFVMKGSLMVHMRVAHFGGAVIARLVESKQLESNSVSPESAQFTCSICNKGFRKEQQLTQHEKLHDGKQCDICLKVFTTKYFLRKHNRLHTGEMPYSCNVCNKSFTFQQSYHKHLLYHSDDKPYTCAECGRAFKELSTLQNHQRIHTGEKPFSCETCGMLTLRVVLPLLLILLSVRKMFSTKSVLLGPSSNSHRCNAL